MVYKDFEHAIKIIDDVFDSRKSMHLADRIECTKKLALLNLTKQECMDLYGYIDRSNSEFNILCFQCRDNCKKSEQR